MISIIAHHLGQMLPVLLIVTIIFVIVRLCRYRKFKMRRDKMNWKHEAALLLFVMVVTGIASQTVVPKFYWENGALGILGQGYADTAYMTNFVPFNKIAEVVSVLRQGMWWYAMSELIGNIGIFIPVGFLLPLLWKKFEKVWITAIICFAMTLFIECIQLLIPLRATDVDDIIMNTIGGIIGYALFLIVRRIFKGKTDKWKPSVPAAR